jgi:hypothetical protein
MMLLCDQSSCGGSHCADLSITCRMSVLALPEWASAGPRSVVVCWGRTIALLLLVVFGEEELNASRNEEEETVHVSKWRGVKNVKLTH